MRFEANIRHFLLIVILTLCVFCISSVKASAVSETGREDHTISDGVTESEVYVTDSTKRNLRVHILRVQNGANAAFKVSYKGYYTENSTKASRKAKANSWSSSNAGYETLKKQAKGYEKTADCEGIVIAASNGDFYTRDGAPLGNLIMEGNRIYSSDDEPFFVVLENGKAEIRTKGESTKGAVEAIGGSKLLVKDGEIKVKEGGDREPRQSIGVTKDGTVVIVNVEGRTPESPGTNLYDLASIMVQQGCDRAINLDGGGSASFLTRREGDSKLVFRNVPGDGIERSVSASIMVIKKNDYERQTKTGFPTVSMENDDAVFKGEDGGKNTYEIGGEGVTGFYTINGKSYLFTKGKGDTETVRIGNTDYYFEDGALTGSSDPDAGRITIGYCGKLSNGNRNLIYAYQYGNHRLNIGLNNYSSKISGQMKNWIGKNKRTLPWYALRSEIEKIYIGDGVTSVGKRFTHVPNTKIFYGHYAPESQLRYLRLPNTLRYIDKNAFFNKPNLKILYIPKSVKYIGEDAFTDVNLKYIIYGGDQLQWKAIKGSGKPTAQKIYFMETYKRKHR